MCNEQRREKGSVIQCEMGSRVIDKPNNATEWRDVTRDRSSLLDGNVLFALPSCPLSSALLSLMEDEINRHGTDIGRHPRKKDLSTWNRYNRASSSNFGDDVGSSGFTTSKKTKTKTHQRTIVSDDEDVGFEILDKKEKKDLRIYENTHKGSLNRFPLHNSKPAARQDASKNPIDVDEDSGDELAIIPEVPDKSYNRVEQVNYDEIPHSSPPAPSSAKMAPPPPAGFMSRPRPTPRAKLQAVGQEGVRSRLMQQG